LLDETEPGRIEIRVENHQYRPPRVIALVGETHPDFEPETLPVGYKQVPDDYLVELLARLEDDGFLELSRELDSASESDPGSVLRRLVVRCGDRTRVLVVPRRPPEELAARFTLMARDVTEAFNAWGTLRYDSDIRDPYYFEKRKRELEAENRRKLSEGGQ
jgi:hypothetical protein